MNYAWLALFVFFAVFVLLFFFIKKQQFSAYSPVVILVVAYIIVYVSGYLFYSSDLAGGSISVRLYHDKDYFVFLVSLAVLAFMLGVVLSNKIFGYRGVVVLGVIDVKMVLLFSVVSVLLFVFGNGVQDLFWRLSYFSEANKEVKVLGTFLVLVSSPLLGAVFFSRKGLWRFALGFVFFLYLTIFIGYSTRILGVSVVLFLLGGGVYTKKTKNFIFFVLGVFCSPFLVSIPLVLRGQYEQGLVPFVMLLQSGVFFDEVFGLAELFNNLILICFPVYYATATSPNLGLPYFLISINPLPGSVVFDDLAEHGLNAATPYSMLGELANLGWMYVISVYFVVGVVFSFVERCLKSQKSFFVVIIMYCAQYIFVLTSLQYTMRASLRFIYYTIALLFLVKFLFYVKNSGSRK